MPVSKKRKKSEKKRDRQREEGSAPSSPAAPSESGYSGGLLGRMRGGIRSVAGQGEPKKESLASKLLTWALILVAAWFVAKRLGIIP
jgi:hypothetical protein